MEVGLSLGLMTRSPKARLGELIVLVGEDVAEYAGDNSRDNHADHGESEVYRIGGDEGRERSDGAKDKGRGDDLEKAEERAAAGTADDLSQEELLVLDKHAEERGLDDGRGRWSRHRSWQSS